MRFGLNWRLVSTTPFRFGEVLRDSEQHLLEAGAVAEAKSKVCSFLYTKVVHADYVDHKILDLFILVSNCLDVCIYLYLCLIEVSHPLSMIFLSFHNYVLSLVVAQSFF